MNAIMYWYFLSQRYELDCVKVISLETDRKHASIIANHATNTSHEIDIRLEVRCSTHQGIQYLRFLVLVLSTFGIGIGIGIESIPGLVNGIDPIVNWY